MVSSRPISETASFLLRICSALARFRRPAYGLCGFVVFTSGLARAENESVWDNVSSGITDVSTAGPVQYTIGYSGIGYDHFRSEVVVNWYGTEDRTQTIYEGIYANPPAKVWGILDHLCVSMENCVRYEDVCETHVIDYRYDIVAELFSERKEDDKICH